MKIYKELIQQTPEWFEVRKMKATASHAQQIGNNGKGLETYIMEMMSEAFSSGEKEYYTNKDMDRGNELEPIARSIYELEKGVKVEEIGFAEYNEFIGCSPDGVMEEGMIEIKSPNDKIYFDILINNKIDSAYDWQCQMNMLILEKKWCDLTFYNPNFEKSMKIFRLLPDEKKQQALLEGFKTVETRIKELQAKYKKL